MKKIINTALSLMVCGAMLAADNTATIQLRVTAVTGGKTDIINLFENEDYSEAFVEGEESKKMSITDDTKVFVYTIVDGEICANKGTDNLLGTEIIVKTNASERYQFSVPYQDGSKHYCLFDKETNILTPILSTSVYEFEAPANQSVTDRFYIYNPVEPTICHQYGQLQVFNYVGDVVIKQMDGTTVGTYPVEGNLDIDLSALTPGQYRVEFNGKTMVIGVKPTVTIQQP